MAGWNEFADVSAGSGDGSNFLNLHFAKEERVEFKIDTSKEPEKVTKGDGKTRWYIPVKLLTDVEDEKGKQFKAGDEIKLNATDYLRAKIVEAFKKAKKEVGKEDKLIVEKDTSNGKNDWKVTVV